MKNLFKHKHERSASIDSTSRPSMRDGEEVEPPPPYNSTSPQYQRNHRRSVPGIDRTYLETLNNERRGQGIDSSNNLSPEYHLDRFPSGQDPESDVTSVALSEADTLFHDKKKQLLLQDSYDDNFVLYLPYIVRQHRLRTQRREERAHKNDESKLDYESDADDELQTIVDQSVEDSDSSLPPAQGRQILEKTTSKFNLKRSYILSSEFIKNSTYIFVSEESYLLFRKLKSGNKKKNNFVVYNTDGTIKLCEEAKPDHFNQLSKPNQFIDHRSHIIPLENKIKGMGLPLFKMQVPYMSSFRKNAPYIVFKKYRETPLPIRMDAAGKVIEEDYESYTFCAVHTKHFNKVRRFIFTFHHPDLEQDFQVVMFLNNIRPFTDFNYKNTRFRIIGTPVATIYESTHNFQFRLLIVDEGSPSLCDNIINRKQTLLLKMIKRRGSDAEDEKTKNNEENLNPYPEPTNPLMLDDPFLSNRLFRNLNFISDNMPPFANYMAKEIYAPSTNVLPKKYNEVGKIELYQDNLQDILEDLDSTKSVDIDSMVLTCILSTLHEISIRSANKVNTTSSPLIHRSFASSGLSFGLFGALSFSAM